MPDVADCGPVWLLPVGSGGSTGTRVPNTWCVRAATNGCSPKMGGMPMPRQPPNAVCATCGTPFRARPNRTTKYCSRDCYLNRERPPGNPCGVPGCTGVAVCRGWCGRHYGRWQKYGDPLGGRPPFEERFWRKVIKRPTGCWEWIGGRSRLGYGHTWKDGKPALAHRASWEMTNGPIPGDLPLDHLCRNASCVNPEHLEPVTQAENVRRGDAGKHWAAKTHCPQGHPYDEINTIRYNGRRICRSCQMAAKRRYDKRRRRAA